MSWYRSGTVTVANGSATVTGAGTDFVQNTQAGEAFRGPDGRTYEIAGVVSATELTLAEAYMGGTGGGQAYAIQPTASFARDLALRAANLLNTFGAVRDGVGQGLFSDGSAAAPGIRFAVDQDTGLRRVGNNALALVAGGVDRVVVDSLGRVGIGGNPSYALDVFSPSGTYVGRYLNMSPSAEEYAVVLIGQAEAGSAVGYLGTGGSAVANTAFRGAFVIGTQNARPLVFTTNDGEKMRIGPDGSLTLRGGAGSRHLLSSNVARTQAIMNIEGAPGPSAVFCAVDNYAPNGTSCAIYLARDNSTGRSLNATGTLNASGADYAEYMTKSDGCGTIAKGDVCGVDGDGHLTKKWADARSFVIKSTDPSYVGGDVWGQSVGPRPEGPGEKPSAPIAPPAAPASEDEADVAAWRVMVAAYPAQQATHQSAHAAWSTAKAAYDTALAAWEAALEVERQKVDRIAFAGQVPVNVTGDFAAGDYIIAVASGAGIKAVAVHEADITFDQYRRRLGKVWAVRDGRAWVDVQHG